MPVYISCHERDNYEEGIECESCEEWCCQQCLHNDKCKRCSIPDCKTCRCEMCEEYDSDLEYQHSECEECREKDSKTCSYCNEPVKTFYYILISNNL